MSLKQGILRGQRPLNNAIQVKIDLRGFFQKNSDKWEIMCYNINDNLF